ncbi:MAG: prepilin-type N-terminal cleavage/methylation domain-containing protein [Candidatus Saccharibacteria bacterium]|nr:prepilin-type N-terminal cleavage/methylation domain-containing protein [Candidatus Saccharibacteria bacterium]
MGDATIYHQKHLNPRNQKRLVSGGFTIVELLVVIVVIGILAAITIVSYTGVNNKAIAVSLKSDLANGAKRMTMYFIDHGNYPATLDGSNCPTGPADTKYCLSPSSGTTFIYILDNTANPMTYSLSATKNNTSYIILSNSAPAQISSNPSLSCPTGFIRVPGSVTYGTADFCVMKYEAKNVGGVATSQAALTPWVNISQTTAITTAAAACTDCHLITEAEWLTIAQNVLNNPVNWSTGTVGSGFIYSGHNDGTPFSALDADSNDSNGYYGTGNVANSNQKRTLTLSDGEVIWDLSGNIMEWTSGTTQSPIVQPGITGNGLNWREWTAVTNAGTILPNPSPASTGIAGAGSWTSANGTGQAYSNTEQVTLRGFQRSGSWSGAGYDGVLELQLAGVPSGSSGDLGFRVSK